MIRSDWWIARPSRARALCFQSTIGIDCFSLWFSVLYRPMESFSIFLLLLR
ncbi:MAG: hypothetical protein ACJA1W_000490 [Akkermansiaceae bacterium]|jgi:hypothetical protein